MLHSKIIQRFSNQLVVKEEGTELQMEFNVWEIFKNFIVHVFSIHSIAMNVFQGQIYEIALLLVDEIIVTYQLLTLLNTANFEKALMNLCTI
jgi:hypothetical protein